MNYLRPSIILVGVAFLAYGLLIPQLGFYWDELPMVWIRYQLGSEALTRYFSTNRPVWGILHQITTHILPAIPIYWQIFALVWRWLGALIVYAIVTKLWKDKPQSALGIALLFLVYPGFNQHWASYLYGHFYIVLFFFLFSILCMLLALESPRQYWVWTGLGLLFSALNLWMMEYFYVLELVRVGVILTALRAESLPLFERSKRTLKLWLPYLGVFVLSVLYRVFVFNNQIYGMGLTSQLRSAPVETGRILIQSILLSLRLVLKDAWLKIFEHPTVAIDNAFMNSYYAVIAVVILLAAAGFLLVQRDASQALHKNLMDAGWMIGLGALAVFLAGWPFWLISFKPSLQWPASRFTLPFIFGVSLIYGGLISAIPWAKLRVVLLVMLV
ncbi:MAG TPA: hypothetical protein VN653_12250, partial [Anaerolineales bacterium]|nr:hypothetical protein [Anaerolineales bacterium]